MALEQLQAFRHDRPQTELGPVEHIGPDGYPLLAGSELRHEHELIGELLLLLQKIHGRPDAMVFALSKLPAVMALSPDPAFRTRLVLALIERVVAYNGELSTASAGHAFSHVFDYGVLPALMTWLMENGADVGQLAEPVLQWFTSYRFAYYGTLPTLTVTDWVIEQHFKHIPDNLRDLLIMLRSQCADLGHYGNFGEQLMAKLDPLLGNGAWQVLAPCEHWTQLALEDLEQFSPEVREDWLALLRQAAAATSARPSAKWLKNAQALLHKVGEGALREALLRWFARVDAGRCGALLNVGWESSDDRARMHDGNATVLRGLLWMSAPLADSELTRAIARLALSAYRKVRGIGPRAPKVGNAAVFALSSIPSSEAVGQLALLKVRVKFGTAQKEIEKAFTSAAQALQLPRDQIEELGVPTYGLEQVGLRREIFDDGALVAELKVDGKSATLSWLRADGTPQKSVPAKVKAQYKEELKELQGALKDIGAMLPAQAERLDSLFLLEKHWPFGQWQERYLDHPLIGTLARRLIWVISEAGQQHAVVFTEGELQSLDGNTVTPSSEAEVRLWHPIGRSLDEVLAWRERIEALQITQPFKQAHREVYLLTEAERNTATYSNRFAAHILRQHQFHALAAARGWRNKLRLMVDDSYPPATRELPAWGLRAEFWIEGVGDDYGVDTNEAGAFLRLSTDQVRFYAIDAAQRSAHAGGGGYAVNRWDNADDAAPLPLEQVPALVLSEVMRDVDLFVGVASLANDPLWADGGPDGRYRDYWHNHSFGELGATAQTRKQLLEKLLPRMTRLKDKWALHGRFLEVTGKLRSYKIHLGSGNILMLPNDQYLCIVPDAKARQQTTPQYLPFEGDALLSIILSKALLLIDDDKISDPTITRQLALK
ncbi:DUF4132 domain-containing protein [Pseudomonas donghuensis]|uniref:DUF4132 domain-containing protein n=1 Tax=Pseudomonas donghuensis TaxID=1163398 RepID=UPI000C29BA35|nr:DUF4132 domain-containing protein [Pseudomonas donghuensis]PJY96724.1 hypothetical protein COO64_07715 [Pseudomonas donghuensis]WKY30600.1 DUF4132 domain-containing protein [Pseudomonas donghuensis]